MNINVCVCMYHICIYINVYVYMYMVVDLRILSAFRFHLERSPQTLRRRRQLQLAVTCQQEDVGVVLLTTKDQDLLRPNAAGRGGALLCFGSSGNLSLRLCWVPPQPPAKGFRESEVRGCSRSGLAHTFGSRLQEVSSPLVSCNVLKR